MRVGGLVIIKKRDAISKIVSFFSKSSSSKKLGSINDKKTLFNKNKLLFFN